MECGIIHILQQKDYMSAKESIEKSRSLIRKAKFKEAFQEIQELLTEVKDKEIKKEISLCEGRFNMYNREKVSGYDPSNSILNSIIGSFYTHLDSLEEIMTNEKEELFMEVGENILAKIEGVFIEGKESDKEFRKTMEESHDINDELKELLKIGFIIRNHMPDSVSKYIHELEFEKGDCEPYVSLNLLKVILTLTPKPYEDLTVEFFNDDLFLNLVTGFSRIAFELWDLFIVGGYNIYYTGPENGNNDLVVEFFTVVDLPDELEYNI